MKRVSYGITGLLIAFAVLVPFSAFASENPKDRLDYWRKNYEELRSEQDPRAAKAHEIFRNVLSAAGKRPGVIPRLFIVSSDAAYIPLAIAIPDGGIIISKKVLDICYREAVHGDDRLAFILAHEIAHQLKDDFWHMKFFQAIETAKLKDGQHGEILNEIRSIADSTEKVLAKELQADEYGIVYASMAGYDTRAIVAPDRQSNFFEYFARALDPASLDVLKKDTTHPTPSQRAEAVRARLEQVLEKVDIFRLGVMFYQTGEYEKAVIALTEFQRFYPGREVYHNIAVSYHQIALKHYRIWKGAAEQIPFKLSISADPETRAAKVNLRGGGTPEEMFKTNLEKAIEHYEKAVSLDPFYAASLNNLGCAFILKGEAYKAIAAFKDALKIGPSGKETLNNIGVAFYMAENTQKARENLNAALAMDSSYDAPLLNLGKIAYEEKNESETKKYWGMYLEKNISGAYVEALHRLPGLTMPVSAKSTPPKQAKESLFGLEAGAYKKPAPAEFGALTATVEMAIGDEQLKINTFKDGVITVLQDGETILLYAGAGSKAKSARDLHPGSTVQDLLAAYGTPTYVQSVGQGENWLYKDDGIAFQIQAGKVHSWIVF